MHYILYIIRFSSVNANLWSKKKKVSRLGKKEKNFLNLLGIRKNPRLFVILSILSYERFMKRATVEERTKTAACSALTKGVINNYDTISRTAHLRQVINKCQENPGFFLR